MSPTFPRDPLASSGPSRTAVVAALTVAGSWLVAGCGSGDDDAAPAVTAQQACAALSGKTIGGSKLMAVAVAASGALPSYCKVNGTLDPSLNFEMRLPDAWNGKLYYGGGGGYNGSIPGLVLPALLQGYAAVASDSGHQTTSPLPDASFALNDPFAAQLFGSLAIPTVMSTALEAVTAAYGTPPTRSYFEGCSEGGREALMAAQRNPNLFDGIIARAPAYIWVAFAGQFQRNVLALTAPGAQIGNTKLSLLSKAVRDACDALDGIVDGIVSNPRQCTFDPTALRCAGGADTGDTCLSDAQIAAVNTITSPVSVAGGVYTSAGWPLTGNEDDPSAWSAWITGGGNALDSVDYFFQDTTVKNYLARNPAQDSLAYAWDSNLDTLYGMAALNDATNADLRPFMNSNGKLIIWHGGSDAALSPASTAAYYRAAADAAGGQTAADSFMRFYVAPGVNHCGGGAGADTTDLLAALDQWVTKGSAPGTLSAQKLDVNGTVTRTVPLCRYPQYPRYTGPANDAAAAAAAANYTCTAP
ncbi:MAG TPA: tannase/feruloyl esterase family alpha/beta hydrolase [Burkholderiaceae bacterium]